MDSEELYALHRRIRCRLLPTSSLLDLVHILCNLIQYGIFDEVFIKVVLTELGKSLILGVGFTVQLKLGHLNIGDRVLLLTAVIVGMTAAPRSTVRGSCSSPLRYMLGSQLISLSFI